MKKGTVIYHENYGEGVVVKEELTSIDVYFDERGKLQLIKSDDKIEIIEGEDEEKLSDGNLSIRDIEMILSGVLDKYNGIQKVTELGEKWLDGTLIIEPGNTELKSKEIPIEAFFHKIVMVRDRLRVLEQNINSHKVLTDEDKVHLQQYITRIYGSLTSFNILFDNKSDFFVGVKSK